MKRYIRSVVPAFLLAISVGQIYAFTNFSTEIAAYTGSPQNSVQFAFSLGIFFLGMGAAFFGRIVEKNIRLATIIGTLLFLSGLCVTSLGIWLRSLALIYIGYGFLVGTGTGIIYISPVKTMMMWFPDHKAIAAALPIISFGLGSTYSTIVYKGLLSSLPIHLVFLAFAGIYILPMAWAALTLKKPVQEKTEGSGLIKGSSSNFDYIAFFKNGFFIRSWIFMFLNISAGLCLIPLAKQMMKSPTVGYPEGIATAIVAISGLMNGGGRFLFAWWSDRLALRINIMLIILSISLGAMTLSFWPPFIGLALLIINACYGAGFSVIPAVLADHYGMANISKIHGFVLSAWGFAGLAGNQAAMLVAKAFGGYGEGGHGYVAVVGLLVVAYFLNLLNVVSLRRYSRNHGSEIKKIEKKSIPLPTTGEL